MQLSDTKNQIDQNAPLPVLRSDLEIVVSPASADGAPTYTIYDPVPRRFSKIGWTEATIMELLRQQTTLASLKSKLMHTTVRLTDEDLQTFINKIEFAGLTTSSLTLPIERLQAQKAASRPGLFSWLLKNYLYIRVPLLRPNRFLNDSLETASLLVSKPAVFLYSVLGIWGVISLILNFDLYFSTFPYFFNLDGLLCYGFSIVILKAIHEFSHAYTAKNYGVRVPVMGVAFIVMWPVAFCDVTDAWKLRKRSQRARIALAGIMAEFTIAGLALFGWSISGPGVFNSICFVVSSTSLLSTLAINLNPAMSFDGYYILMDIWGVDNLRPRSFGVTRWFYLKHLFGVQSPCPEKELKPKRLCAFLVYSVYSWLYRLGLYFGIAVLMYYKFTKAIGLFLFAVEIWSFILKPFGMEMKNLIKNKGAMRVTRPGATFLALLFLLFIWATLPIKRSLEAPAVIVPREIQVVHAPTSGQIIEVNAGKGDMVAKNQLLAVIDSQELNAAILNIQNQLEILQIERGNLELSEKERPFLPQKDDEIAQAEAKLSGLLKEKKEQQIKSRLSGKVVWWNENMREGTFAGQNISLGRIAGTQQCLIRAFVTEEKISSIVVGDKVKFYPASAESTIQGKVTRISPARTEHIEHVALTSMSQGIIPVTPDESGNMRLLASYYAVEIEPIENSPLLLGQSGTALLNTKAQSLLLDWLRNGYRVLLRESGF